MKALSLFGCWSLSQRISEMRADGIPIMSKLVTAPSGKRHAIYWLEPQEHEQHNKTRATVQACHAYHPCNKCHHIATHMSNTSNAPHRRRAICSLTRQSDTRRTSLADIAHEQAGSQAHTVSNTPPTPATYHHTKHMSNTSNA